MPLGEDRTRVNVTLSTSMLEKIDRYREDMGLSRSAFCGFVIGQHVMAMDKAMSQIDFAAKSMIDLAKEAKPPHE